MTSIPWLPEGQGYEEMFICMKCSLSGKFPKVLILLERWVLERNPFERGAPTDMHNFTTHLTLLPSIANVRAGIVIEVLCTNETVNDSEAHPGLILSPRDFRRNSAFFLENSTYYLEPQR